MISVIIATADSERALVPTLTALVPGALAGVICEVIVTDGGSRDATATVADVAGCRFLDIPGPVGARLKAGAAAARGRWLFFLRPGAVPEVTWVDEVDHVVRDAEIGGRPQAAVFHRVRRGSPGSPVRDALSVVAAALGGRPHADQGLLITKRLYDTIGGHRTDSADAETDLLRRLGRHGVVTLRSGLTTAK